MARRFDKPQTDAILRRAIELKRDHPTRGGHTLEEIEEIAAAAGIDRELVRRAAREAGETSGSWDRLLGGPPSLEYEEYIEGEIDESAHESILAALHELPYNGTVSTAGRALSWSHQKAQGTRDIKIMVTPVEGKTRIRVVERTAGIKGLVWGVWGGAVAINIAILGAILGGELVGPLGALLGGAAGMSTVALANPMTRNLINKRRHALADHIDELREVVEKHARLAPGERDLAAARQAQGLVEPDAEARVAEQVVEEQEEPR